MDISEVMKLLSPAKVNLGLSIVGRNSQGFHLLESLFWPVDFCDEINITEAPQLSVSTSWAPDAPVTSSDLPDEKRNLIYRALSSSTKATVTVNKRIPIGSGLGGGSSNAATAIRYFEPDIDPLSLGADVPFFLNPKPSWITGVGEEIHPLQVDSTILRQVKFLLVFPPFGISTPEIFSAFRKSELPFSKSIPPPTAPLNTVSLRDYLSIAKNDLETVICEKYPSVASVLEKLRGTPCLYAGVSGTGSTIVAVYLEKIPNAVGSICRSESCRSVIVGSRVES